MNSRPSSPTKYSHLIDEDRASSKLGSGGMVTTQRKHQAWEATSSETSKHHANLTHEVQRQLSNPNHHTNSHLSTQQRGASKIVIPGDKTKPRFLIKAMAFCTKELRILGASEYILINLSVPGSDPKRMQVYREVHR